MSTVQGFQLYLTGRSTSPPSSCKRRWSVDFELQQFRTQCAKREKGERSLAGVVREVLVKSVELKLVRKLQFWKAKEQGHFPSWNRPSREEEVGAGCVWKSRKEPSPQQWGLCGQQALSGYVTSLEHSLFQRWGTQDGSGQKVPPFLPPFPLYRGAYLTEETESLLHPGEVDPVNVKEWTLLRGESDGVGCLPFISNLCKA